MFSHHVTRKISPICNISIFSEDPSFLNPRSHLKCCLVRNVENERLFEMEVALFFFSNTLHKCLHLVLAKERDFAFFLASQKIAELQRIKEIATYSANYRDIVLTYSKEAVTLGSLNSIS